MGRHAGHAAPGPATGRPLLLHACAVLATLIAWGLLVWFAIQLGPSAKAGELTAWLLLLVATLGAIGCLFLALMQGSRIYDLVRAAAQPPRSGGGKRARR